MNTTTPYEQTIATRLDQVPVPDMADSIWAGIEMQLDGVGQAPDVPAKKPAPQVAGKVWYGLAGVVAVVSTLWWYQSRTVPPPARPKPEKVLPAPVDSSQSTDSITVKTGKDRPVAPPIRQVSPAPLPTATPQEQPPMDSVAEVKKPPVVVDTPSIQPFQPPVPAVDSVNSKLPGKRPKGVPGITNDDYKLSAGKDTSKKGP